MSKATELAQELMITHKSHADEGPTAFSEAAAELLRIETINAELLEALQELLSEASEGIATSPLTRNKARAAIAKATQGEVK